MTKRALLVLSILSFLTGTVFCAEGGGAEEEKTAVPAQQQAVTHKVVKGDTLWSISGKYYNDPWLWQKLWQVNKTTLNDPNIIYPGQEFSIPDKVVLNDVQVDTSALQAVRPEMKAEVVSQAAVAGEKEVVAEQAEEPAVVETVKISGQQSGESAEVPSEEPLSIAELPGVNKEAPVEEAPQTGEVRDVPASAQVTSEEAAIGKKYFSSEGMVVPKGWTEDGVIADQKDKKIMISAGDTVYVNIGSDRVKAGDLCMVYRKMGKIKDPARAGKKLGYEMLRVGKLEITGDVGENVSTAMVVVSYEPMKKGDVVKIVSPDR